MMRNCRGKRSTSATLAVAAGLWMIVALVGNGALAQGYSVEEELANADWQKQTVAEGVVWKRAHLEDLYGLPQSINVLEVNLNRRGIEVDVAASDTGRVKTSVMARSAGATAAVNGSFFNVDNGASVVFFQRNGRAADQSQGEIAAYREEAAVATERNGDAGVIRRVGADWERMPRLEDVLASGPLLVWNGRVADTRNVGFNVTHHPRTALGITDDNHLIMVAVDGRARRAAGMTTRELAWMMRGLGSTAAVNLDGGGSTTMWIKGTGVVNYPSDNGAYDHQGERAVANAVVIFAHGADGAGRGSSKQ